MQAKHVQRGSVDHEQRNIPSNCDAVLKCIGGVHLHARHNVGCPWPSHSGQCASPSLTTSRGGSRSREAVAPIGGTVGHPQRMQSYLSPRSICRRAPRSRPSRSQRCAPRWRVPALPRADGEDARSLRQSDADVTRVLSETGDSASEQAAGTHDAVRSKRDREITAKLSCSGPPRRVLVCLGCHRDGSEQH